MSQMSNFMETKVITDLLRTPTVNLHLYTSNPDEDDSGVEVTGGSYAAQEAVLGADTDGVTTTTADITFPAATADWGIVTHFGIKDASANLLVYGSLAVSKTVNSGDTIKFTTGNLTVTLA